MRQSLLRSEATVTLVELLVVMVLLGVVGGIVGTAVTTSLRSATASTSRVLALDELQTGLQRIVRDLRSATVEPSSSSPDDFVTMEVLRGGEPQDVTYELVGDRLIRSETGQELVAEIDNASFDVPLFEYYDQLGDPVDCTPTCSGAATIRVQLVRGIDGRSPVIVETEVAIRNLRYRS